MKKRIIATLLLKRKDPCDNMSKEDRQVVAEEIGTNCARSLFSILRSRETIKQEKVGKYYDPMLFLPEDNPFFDIKDTYFNTKMKDKNAKDHGIHTAKSQLK